MLGASGCLWISGDRIDIVQSRSWYSCVVEGIMIHWQLKESQCINWQPRTSQWLSVPTLYSNTTLLTANSKNKFDLNPPVFPPNHWIYNHTFPISHHNTKHCKPPPKYNFASSPCPPVRKPRQKTLSRSPVYTRPALGTGSAMTAITTIDLILKDAVTAVGCASLKKRRRRLRSTIRIARSCRSHIVCGGGCGSEASRREGLRLDVESTMRV
ncbi:hypothetical protein J1614_006979 [Plenodomus biglobosus]|nr:hypothetical protein J1614_006979 [Plenodomus biglobosus]